MKPLEVEDAARVYECPFMRSIVEADAMGPNPSTPLARELRRLADARAELRAAAARLLEQQRIDHAEMN